MGCPVLFQLGKGRRGTRPREMEWPERGGEGAQALSGARQDVAGGRASGLKRTACVSQGLALGGRFDRTEDFAESPFQGDIEIGHGDGQAEVDEAGYPVALDATGHDA